MSPNTIRGLQVAQWGRESTRGTAVPATSKAVVEVADFEPEDAYYRPNILNGVLLDHPGGEFVITRGSKFSLSGPLSYQQAQHVIGEFMIQGNVTPTGGPTFVWTYTRAANAIPTPSSFTLERRLSDGAANQIDNEWAYCMANSLTLTGAVRGVVTYKLDGYARRIQASTLTPALSLPTIELASHGTSKVFLDTTFGGVGGTQVVGQLLNWELVLKPGGTVPFFTADGRSDLDFGLHVFDSSQAGLTFKATMLVNTQYATEKTAAEASTLRAVRLQLTGTSPNDIKIDFLAKHELGSLFKVDTLQGQDVVTLSLTSATDGTSFVKAVITNLIATLV